MMLRPTIVINPPTPLPPSAAATCEEVKFCFASVCTKPPTTPSPSSATFRFGDTGLRSRSPCLSSLVASHGANLSPSTPNRPEYSSSSCPSPLSSSCYDNSEIEDVSCPPTIEPYDGSRSRRQETTDAERSFICAQQREEERKNSVDGASECFSVPTDAQSKASICKDGLKLIRDALSKMSSEELAVLGSTLERSLEQIQPNTSLDR